MGCWGRWECCGREVGQIAAVRHDEGKFAGRQTGRYELDAAHIDASAVVVEVLRGNRLLQWLWGTEGVRLVGTGRSVGERSGNDLLEATDAIAEVTD